MTNSNSEKPDKYYKFSFAQVKHNHHGVLSIVWLLYGNIC